MATGPRTHDHYTVAWVCSLHMEQAAVMAMLDERHADLPKPPNDDNTYALGSIGEHNIGPAAIAARMAGTFPSIKLGLMVGIDGGIPDSLRDTRLGDKVVSTSVSQFPGGVAQWDSGKAKEGGNVGRTGALDHPSTSLLPSINFRSPIPLAERNARKVSDFTSGLKQHFVEGDVGGTLVEAFPDTGADMCFISPKLASGLGLGPAAGTQKRIHLANKKHIQSPGMVEVPWRFAREQKAHILNCWILPGCVHDLVLGNHFLRATHTLTKFTSRIKSKLLELPRRLRLRLLGEEKQRLWGSLNGHLTAALPDTGSDVMLISSAYARKIGLTIDRYFENWLEVEFADGTTAWTSGVVRDVSWNVGRETVRCDFHVLDDLCVDVILSKHYLFDLNVFSEHGQCFFDTDSEEEFFQLCNIRLIGRYGDTLNILEEGYLEDLTSPDAFGPEMVQRELARRDQIRDEISALPENEREAATQAEAERQRRWQDLRQAHRTRWTTASSVPQSSNGHGNAHRTETYRDRTRTSERPPTEEVAGGGLQGVATRRTLWKKRVSIISIPLRSMRRSTRA